MSTFQFETSFLTLGDIQRQVRLKLGEDVDLDATITDWANTVVQFITVEFPQPSLLSDGEDQIVGNGTARIFSLPIDFHKMVSMKQPSRSQLGLEEVSVKQLAEQFEVFDPIPVRDPDYYTIVGRKGTFDADEPLSAINPLRIKFDAIPTDGSIFRFFYYKLHHKLSLETHPILLPPEYHSLVVDGVLLEAAEFVGVNDADYNRKERKWFRRLKQVYKRRHEHPNRVLIKGDFDIDRGSPGRPQFPDNYPR